MFGKTKDKQFHTTLAIASSMSGLWLLGVVALSLVPADDGSRKAADNLNFRHQASGATYAYQDVTGQFTVYVRGTQRMATP